MTADAREVRLVIIGRLDIDGDPVLHGLPWSNIDEV